MAKINGNAIRVGDVIEYEGKLWRAMKTQHTQPGKGGAYLQAELKEVRDGTKTNVRFRAAEGVERVELERRDFQFLYKEGDMFTFMNTETYEQVALPGEQIGEDQVPYLQDGMTIYVEAFEDQVLGISLPEHVTLEIVEADPVVKGQSAASSYKSAVLSNGVRTLVPPFIEAGTRVVIATSDGHYVERAKD
jgi:elongation factor P